jgi:hypothetical protein
VAAGSALFGWAGAEAVSVRLQTFCFLKRKIADNFVSVIKAVCAGWRYEDEPIRFTKISLALKRRQSELKKLNSAAVRYSSLVEHSVGLE